MTARKPLWPLLLPVALVGIVVGGLLAWPSPADPRQESSPVMARFSVHHPGNGLAVVDAGRIDRAAGHADCAAAAGALVRSGAGVLWSDDPLEIAVRAEQSGVVEIHYGVIRTVSVEPAPSGLGSFHCPRQPAAPTPDRPPHGLAATVGANVGEDIGDVWNLDPAPDGPMVSGFSLQLGAGEVQPFTLRVRHSDPATVVRWTLHVEATVNGEQRTFDIDNGGQPFTTIGSDLRGQATGPAERLDGGRVQQAPSDDFDLAAAAALISAEGFDPPTAAPSAGPLRAFKAMCTGSANGRCNEVFFFDGNRVAGRFTAGTVTITAQDGAEVTVELPQYQPGDAGCCPSGPPSTHVVRLVDGQAVAEPPIPENPNGG